MASDLKKNKQSLLKISAVASKMGQINEIEAHYTVRVIITPGFYTFYPLFEVDLCTVTFVWFVFKSGF